MSAQISIVIPTYKRPEMLHRSLASIQYNLMHELDILVIDDDPEMSGSEVVKKYPNVRYFAKRGINRGLSESRNLGIKFSEGRYILFLDDDDYLLPNAIDSFAASINSKSSFYFGDFKYLTTKGEEFVSLEAVPERKLLVVNEIPVGAYIIEKSSIKSPFDVSMRSHEDWQFLLQNVDWNFAQHLNECVVGIDKTSEDDSSMQNRRRQYFWMDFLTIYAKFPEPGLANLRSQVLQSLGTNVPVELLCLEKKF
jgi:glycosyltransferase involved in cell wall biosynthesis